MVILETPRLVLRRLQLDDAPYILELLNDPDFIRFIADRGVRTLHDAEQYLRTGPLASYERFGHGLFRVSLKASGMPIGMCGLLKRDELDDVDIGFAYLPQYCGQGYAFEVASELLAQSRKLFNLSRIVAITNLDNIRSINLLGRLGFVRERTVKMPSSTQELLLFGRTA